MVHGKKRAACLLLALICAFTMTAAFGVTTDKAEAKTKYNPNSIQTRTWDYLIRQGCSPAAAAGIMGNIEQESSFYLRAGGVSKGLFQLSRYHMRRIRSLAKRRNTSWYALSTQLEYATKYMSQEMPIYTKYSWARYKKLKSPAKAAKVWEKGVERAGIPMMHNRVKYAKKYYNMYKNRKVPGLPKVSGVKEKQAVVRLTTI